MCVFAGERYYSGNSIIVIIIIVIIEIITGAINAGQPQINNDNQRNCQVPRSHRANEQRMGVCVGALCVCHCLAIWQRVSTKGQVYFAVCFGDSRLAFQVPAGGDEGF